MSGRTSVCRQPPLPRWGSTDPAGYTEHVQLLKVQLPASHTTPPRGSANLSAASQATASPPFLDPRTEGVLKLLSAHAIPLLPYLKGAHRHQCQPTAGLNLRSLSPHRTPMLRPPRPPPHLTHHLVPASSTPRGRSHFHGPPQQNQPPAYKQVLTSALLILGLDTCFCVCMWVACLVRGTMFGP